ncbi:hypothetical protein GIB67_032875 [Kingdonia uniflora]|uniref:Peptidase A2 domain-containing protein n=1 Tax=Kingdonia uniflora TaxID=39325 RepID=A0A7J7NBX5_9MAGN|nr:hypothetical protein GIB67_032875 [Kingdonia uniflora]
MTQATEQAEEKHLYHLYCSNMIEINQVSNSNRVKRRKLGECCDLVVEDKEPKLLPESGSRRKGIFFEDCDTRHMKYPHHDALVIMLKMRNFVMHTMMVDTGSRVEILFQCTIDQMGLSHRVVQGETDISGFNGSKEVRVGKITLPITAGPTTVDVIFYVINDQSRYLGILGRYWLHNMEAIPSTFHQILRFKHNNGIYEIKGSQKLSRACENTVPPVLDHSE